MESFLSYYKNNWNPGFSGNDTELETVLERSGDIIGNAVNVLSIDLSRVPFYLLENVTKAVCAQADAIFRVGGFSAFTAQSGGESVKIGQFSVSGGGVAKPQDFKLCDEALGFLYKTDLLNMSVAVC
jgi:hypothetical protein